MRDCSCLSFSYAYLLWEGVGLRWNSRFWFSCWLRRCFVNGCLRSCRLCVFSGDLFLLQQHRSEILLRPWFCRLYGLTGISEFGTWDESGCALCLETAQRWFWMSCEFWRDETLGDSLHGGHRSVLRFVEAVLLVSKLKAEVRFCRLHWRRMKSETISFLHDGSYRCGSPIVWLVGENLDFSCLRSTDTCILRSLLSGPSGTARNQEDIMHKAMVLLDIHFEVAHPANFVRWRWLRSASRRSACEIDIVDVEMGCGNISL